MKTKTLAERISRNFAIVKLKKASVKVPKLKKTKKHPKGVFLSGSKDDKFPVSSLISFMIKAAVEKAKREKKEKNSDEENKTYKILKDERELISNGGYGTVSKNYGTSPHTSYVDYGKIFGYLGKFKSQSAYENMGHQGFINKSLEDKGFSLVDSDTMEKGSRYVKYLFSHAQDFYSTTTSLVAPGGSMSSAEWEQFKLWMKLDPVMFRLKTSTS